MLREKVDELIHSLKQEWPKYSEDDEGWDDFSESQFDAYLSSFGTRKNSYGFWGGNTGLICTVPAETLVLLGRRISTSEILPEEWKYAEEKLAEDIQFIFVEFSHPFKMPPNGFEYVEGVLLEDKERRICAPVKTCRFQVINAA